MSLIQTIQTDTTQALKSGDKPKLNALRFIVSQLKYKEIELRREPTDDEVVAVIRKEIKELSEASEQFKTAGRNDLCDENMQQVSIMKTYLPPEISDDELSILISSYIEENKDAYVSNPRAFTGKVVSALKSRVSPDRIVQMYNKLPRT
ncbi:GatB/YqeY domain-containing protein [Candidatus Woesebacteria bacterium]|nr:GatB/YqeY domain-containing protein [Candidatus Woesebacteria bacterium]